MLVSFALGNTVNVEYDAYFGSYFHCHEEWSLYFKAERACCIYACQKIG
jgi:hypothetical protein